MQNNNSKLTPTKNLALKDLTRNLIYPTAAKVMHSAGTPWEDIATKLGRETFIAQAKEIIASLPARNQTKHGAESLDITFLTMIGGHTYNASVDVVLALALKAQGHSVSAILCDQQLPLCETKKAKNKADWVRNCARCWDWGKRFFGAYGIDVIPVSQILEESNRNADSWDTIVDAAMLKHYGVGVLDPELCESLDSRRNMYQDSARISATVGTWLAKKNPDRVIMSHGIYSTWGPAREILDNANIKLVTYGKAKKRQTQKFNWQTSADWWDISKEWEKLKDTPLNEPQLDIINNYLDSRRNHTEDTLKYNFGEEESKEETRARLGIDPSKQTFTLFTNVLWDAASAQREIAFSDPIDWVYKTIEWFASNPQKQLIIKIHPAEVVIGTNQPFSSLIQAQFKSLPDNVRLIEPHEEVNSWSILKVTDVGLVHTSTVGIELALEGIPCIVVSKTHYRGRGFTIDIDGSESYFNLLNSFDVNTVDRDSMMELAKRYSYILFERYQLPFDFLVEPEHTQALAFTFEDIESLVSHPTMQVFLSSVENLDEFLLPPHE